MQNIFYLNFTPNRSFLLHCYHAKISLHEQCFEIHAIICRFHNLMNLSHVLFNFPDLLEFLRMKKTLKEISRDAAQSTHLPTNGAC